MNLRRFGQHATPACHLSKIPGALPLFLLDFTGFFARVVLVGAILHQPVFDGKVLDKDLYFLLADPLVDPEFARMIHRPLFFPLAFDRACAGRFFVEGLDALAMACSHVNTIYVPSIVCFSVHVNGGGDRLTWNDFALECYVPFRVAC